MPHRTFDNPNSLEAREFLGDQAHLRKHPKRHRTLKRRRKMSEQKKKKVAHYIDNRDAKLRRWKDGVRAYFAGAIDACPRMPTF
jgi:hypothetical protein